VLHKAALEPGESEERAGFRVTTPLRTLLDAAAGGVSLEQLGKAVTEALARGLVRRGALEAALQDFSHRDRIESAMGKKRTG
jgi:hypothetical protein